MIYDKKRHNLAHPQGLAEFNDRVEYYKETGQIVELGLYKYTRSTLQNDSLHLYCKLIAEALNNAGYSYSIVSILTGELTEIPFTMEIIKESLWRAIQIASFGIKSTTKITSREINQIIDIITDFLAQKGIRVDFPNKNRIIDDKNK